MKISQRAASFRSQPVRSLTDIPSLLASFVLARFAKKAWAWTTIPFLAHAILHPHLPTSSTSRLRSLVKYFTATLYWAFLTIWAVGPSLFDRTMVYTGGECSVVVPRAVCERGEVDCAGAVSVGKGALMVVPREFCHLGKVSAQRLAAALSGYVVTGEENFRKETLEEWWSNLKPRWSGGHDVSGHVFLLTLSAVLLFGEVWPTLVLLRRTGWNFARVGVRGYVAVGGALIVGLWVFILSEIPSPLPFTLSSAAQI